MDDSFDAVFEASFERVTPRGAYNPDFIEGFYRRFLGSSDDVARRFARTDIARQKTMLHDSLETLVEFSRNHRLTAQLTRLARVHSRGEHDIPPALYDSWLDALMATVADFDPQFSQDVEIAWRLTLAPGIAYLKFGYAYPPSP